VLSRADRAGGGGGPALRAARAGAPLVAARRRRHRAGGALRAAVAGRRAPQGRWAHGVLRAQRRDLDRARPRRDRVRGGAVGAPQRAARPHREQAAEPVAADGAGPPRPQGRRERRRVLPLRPAGQEPGSSGRAGFSEAKGALEKSNYEVKSLALALKAAIPDDAAVVVIAGPRTDLFAPEVDALDRYLAKGGKVLAMVDPPFPGKMQDAVIKRFLGRWGVDLGDNLVVELSPIGRLFGIGPEVPIIQQYEPHPITRDLAGNQFLNWQGNRDFFLNTVSWLAEEEDQITVRPKDTKQTPIFLSAQQGRVVAVLPLVVLPGLVLAGGIVALVRRRAAN